MDTGIYTTKAMHAAVQLDRREQPALVTAQGTAAVVLDLQEKPGTNSNLILLSTAGLGSVSLDLCRKNFWGKQIGFFRTSSIPCIDGV